jgi:hypothetical protein
VTQTLGTTAFPANDIYIGSNGNLVILQGQQAVQAACQSASLLQLGEAVLATTTGVPYFQTVFNGTPNIAAYQSYLRKAILNVQGVIGITSLTVNVGGGVLNYTAVINSVFGQLEIASGEIPVG